MTLPRVPWAFSASSRAAAQFFVQIWLRQVARDVRHLVGKPRPRVFVDVVGIELRSSVADKAFQHVIKVLTPAFGGPVRPGDANQGKLLRQHFAARKIVKCRHHQSLGQIAGGAKDDQRAGIGGLGFAPRRAFNQACRRRRPDRYLVKHDGAVQRRLRPFRSPRGVTNP